MKSSTLSQSDKARLEKLMALVDRGVGGESTNAQVALDRKLKSLGLTMLDVFNQEAETETVWFYYKTKVDKRLLIQTAAYLFGHKFGKFYTNKYKKNKLGIRVTKSQHAEIALHYDVYVKALREETEVLYSAFLHKNNIFAQDQEQSTDEPERTPDDMRRLEKVALMMAGMDTSKVRKRIA